MRRSMRCLGPLSLALALAAMPAAAQRRGDCGGMEPTSWDGTIASLDEPGEPLVVSGVVLGADGEPRAGVTLLIYHTDTEGYYSRGGSDERTARLCTVLRTDDEGRYRFGSIRPAPYPGSGVPAHVHYEAWGDGIRRQRFELQFAGDPMLGGRPAGTESWARIRPATRDPDGVWRVTKGLKLSE